MADYLVTETKNLSSYIPQSTLEYVYDYGSDSNGFYVNIYMCGYQPWGTTIGFLRRIRESFQIHVQSSDLDGYPTTGLTINFWNKFGNSFNVSGTFYFGYFIVNVSPNVTTDGAHSSVHNLIIASDESLSRNYSSASFITNSLLNIAFAFDFTLEKE